MGLGLGVGGVAAHHVAVADHILEHLGRGGVRLRDRDRVRARVGVRVRVGLGLGQG